MVRKENKKLVENEYEAKDRNVIPGIALTLPVGGGKGLRAAEAARLARCGRAVAPRPPPREGPSLPPSRAASTPDTAICTPGT